MRTLLVIVGCLFTTTRLVSDEPWWSLQPLAKAKTPATEPHLVDAWVAKSLQEKRLTPVGPADRRTLIRRLTFDLTGLPPTPAEVDAFVADNSPTATAKLIDRLLASPRYGERQARWWMDLVHYAETHGHDQDRVRPNAWRYRDYLIGSFNADNPYARFTHEQIAADAIFPQSPQLTPALGLLAAGPWDESSLRDIREDSIDREAGRYLDRDDIVTTVMGTFLGLTVHCARCHDHKFDPIPQSEYYRLQAVFAGVGRGEVEYDADLATGRKREELTLRLKAIETRDPALLAKISGEDFRRGLLAWESKLPSVPVWTPAAIVKAVSEQGSTLATQPDGSVSAEGKRPDRDTYSVTLTPTTKPVTAIRIEVLADDRLPHRGPGRQENGNLHLSEVQLSTHRGSLSQTLAVGAAVSDYDQPGWTISHAVDGNPATAWGIYPKVGESHQAILPLKQKWQPDAGSSLVVRLLQLHGQGHLIGRFPDLADRFADSDGSGRCAKSDRSDSRGPTRRANA